MLAVAPPLVVAGQLLGHPVLTGLGAFAVAAVLVALVPTSGRIRPAVERTVHPQRLERGQPASAVLVVRNDTAQRQPAFVAADRTRSSGPAGPGSGSGTTVDATVDNSVDSAVGDAADDVAVTEVAVPALPPGGTSVHRYAVPTARRGRLEIGPLRVDRSDPLGLAQSRTLVGDAVSLWVLPRRHPVRVAGGGRSRHHHEGLVPDRPLRGTTDLRALREYVPGDELRHVHWRASAKIGQLLVREYVDPVQPHCTVVLDTRETTLDADAFEEAVEVAASVLWAAAGEDHHVALVTDRPGPPAGGRGPDGGRVALDRLAAATRRPGHDLARTLEAVRRGPRGGWLVLVTGSADPAVLGAVTALREGFRPITVFDLSGWAQSVDVPGAVTVRARTAREALELWNGRDAA
jgi:uncharacterized protein (DUF58 family)